ncbi:MAG: hypothetical protein WC521_04465 [Bdellovibrionales bacterium]|jgi:hypothetical protein
MNFITENSQLLSVLTAVIGGVFAFIKWIDVRHMELREKRYAKYMELVSTISGRHPDGNALCITEQIAAVWFLLEYKEYRDITFKIFSSKDVLDTAKGPTAKILVPHIEHLMKEIAP